MLRVLWVPSVYPKLVSKWAGHSFPPSFLPNSFPEHQVSTKGPCWVVRMCRLCEITSTALVHARGRRACSHGTGGTSDAKRIKPHCRTCPQSPRKLNFTRNWISFPLIFCENFLKIVYKVQDWLECRETHPSLLRQCINYHFSEAN